LIKKINQVMKTTD